MRDMIAQRVVTLLQSPDFVKLDGRKLKNRLGGDFRPHLGHPGLDIVGTGGREVAEVAGDFRLDQILAELKKLSDRNLIR